MTHIGHSLRLALAAAMVFVSAPGNAQGPARSGALLPTNAHIIDPDRATVRTGAILIRNGVIVSTSASRPAVIGFSGLFRLAMETRSRERPADHAFSRAARRSARSFFCRARTRASSTSSLSISAASVSSRVA